MFESLTVLVLLLVLFSIQTTFCILHSTISQGPLAVNKLIQNWFSWHCLFVVFCKFTLDTQWEQMVCTLHHTEPLSPAKHFRIANWICNTRIVDDPVSSSEMKRQEMHRNADILADMLWMCNKNNWRWGCHANSLFGSLNSIEVVS